MPRRTPLSFTARDRDALGRERYGHPDPRVQQRMEVRWLISPGETRARCGQRAGVSKATVTRYIAIFRQHGAAGLHEFHWAEPTSALETHQPALGVEFRARPPHTIAEAAVTGVRRKETRVRGFRKNVWV